jgi:hypothetical protein
MRNVIASNRAAWLAGGLVAGLAIAALWRSEPTYATTADRDTQFMMVTIPVGTSAAGINDPMDGVFILDFFTGQLRGAVLNRQTGQFVSYYLRNLAKDFELEANANAEPHYCMVTGYAQLPSAGGATMASGVIYVGELTSGKVVAYGFPWKETGTPGPIELTAYHWFQWKTPAKGK